MSVSYHVNRAVHVGYLESAGSDGLEDLERAITELLAESEFDASFGVLLELGGRTAWLAPTRALSVAELFASRYDRVRGPVAVCVPGMEEYATGRLIAILGRYRGVWMEAFQDRRAALRWLAECMDEP